MRYAKCHPSRQHKALGLCDACYSKHRRDRNPEYKERANELRRKSRKLGTVRHPGTPKTKQVTKRCISCLGHFTVPIEEVSRQTCPLCDMLGHPVMPLGRPYPPSPLFRVAA